MSEHSVVIRKISEIVKHPNADTLELVKLEGLGYTIITKQDTYKVGDEVVLFQDSLIIPEYMINYFELKYLHKGMVKPAKIRGIVSQAMILPLIEFSMIHDGLTAEVYNNFNNFYFEWLEHKNDPDYDYSTVLGVTRKEEAVTDSGKSKGQLPYSVEKYDLDNIERYPDIFNMLLDSEVMITEKLEGTNFAVHIVNAGDTLNVYYCSRSLIREGGLYQELPEKHNVHVFAQNLLQLLSAKTVTIRGELIGTSIQGNIYGLGNQDLYVFDIKVNGEYLNATDTKQWCEVFNVKHVPVIYEGVLGEIVKTVDDIKNWSNGTSILNDKVLREGVVIKMLGDMRVIIKQRSPDYLAQ